MPQIIYTCRFMSLWLGWFPTFQFYDHLMASWLVANFLVARWTICFLYVYLLICLLFLQPASLWWIRIYCVYLVESCQHHQCLSSNGAVASSCQPRHSGWSRRFGLFCVLLIFHSFSNHPEIVKEHSFLLIIINTKTASHVIIL